MNRSHTIKPWSITSNLFFQNAFQNFLCRCFLNAFWLPLQKYIDKLSSKFSLTKRSHDSHGSPRVGLNSNWSVWNCLKQQRLKIYLKTYISSTRCNISVENSWELGLSVYLYACRCSTNRSRILQFNILSNTSTKSVVLKNGLGHYKIFLSFGQFKGHLFTHPASICWWKNHTAQIYCWDTLHVIQFNFYRNIPEHFFLLIDRNRDILAQNSSSLETILFIPCTCLSYF